MFYWIWFLSCYFFSEKTDALCDRLRLKFHEKQRGIDTYSLDDEIVGIIDKILQYKFTTRTQQRKF